MARPRFMLFTWDTYYPGGARNDVHGSYTSPGEAVGVAGRVLSDYAAVLDLDTGDWFDVRDADDIRRLINQTDREGR